MIKLTPTTTAAAKKMMIGIRLPLANESTIKGIIRVNAPKMVKIDTIFTYNYTAPSY